MTDAEIFALAEQCGWDADRQRYMTPRDQHAWCNQMRAFVRAAAHGSEATEPVFWYRPVGTDGGYEGPVHHKSVGGKMMRDEKPGEWVPLYAA